ncbi:MAG: hypothetical protein V1885_01790 [Candidatus Brennerbacteria bacterium]
MEEHDVSSTKEKGTLRGKGKLFDILLRWPLLPKKQLEAVKEEFERRKKSDIRLGFTDM